MSAALFWLIPAAELWKLYVFSCVFGIGNGGDVVEAPLVADLFGLKSHGSIFGIVVLGFTIGAALGPIVAGYLFDVTGSYDTAFLVCAVLAITGFIIAEVIRPLV